MEILWGKTSHAENQKITGLARQEVLCPVQGPKDMGDGTARLPAWPILDSQLRKSSAGGMMRASNDDNLIHLEQNAGESGQCPKLT